MTPSDLEKLRADPSVTWIDRDRYRLAGDPSWLTRKVPQLKPETPEKSESDAERERRKMYERMASYEGSPEYQAMLARNGGVAPGQKEPRSTRGSASIYIGPRGGKYRINRNGRKSYDVP